jgi:hypothetical protein
MLTPSHIPPVFLELAGYIAGVILILGGTSLAVGALTRLRRTVRYCLISWRAEGWGGANHPNQELIAADPPPTLELIKGLAAGKAAPAPLPVPPRDRDPDLAPAGTADLDAEGATEGQASRP